MLKFLGDVVSYLPRKGTEMYENYLSGSKVEKAIETVVDTIDENSEKLDLNIVEELVDVVKDNQCDISDNVVGFCMKKVNNSTDCFDYDGGFTDYGNTLLSQQESLGKKDITLIGAFTTAGLLLAYLGFRKMKPCCQKTKKVIEDRLTEYGLDVIKPFLGDAEALFKEIEAKLKEVSKDALQKFIKKLLKEVSKILEGYKGSDQNDMTAKVLSALTKVVPVLNKDVIEAASKDDALVEKIAKFLKLADTKIKLKKGVKKKLRGDNNTLLDLLAAKKNEQGTNGQLKVLEFAEKQKAMKGRGVQKKSSERRTIATSKKKVNGI